MNMVRAIPWVCSQRFRWLIIAAVTLAGIVWLLGLGSVPVIRISIATSLNVPFWYMVTTFPVLGMLVADVFVLRATYRSNILWIELTFQIALLIFVSSLRLSFAIPISGHALLFSYFILRRIVIGIAGHACRTQELVIAVVLFAIMAGVKVFVWFDYISLILGTAVAGLVKDFRWVAG